jgi:hypothetical protein
LYSTKLAANRHHGITTGPCAAMSHHLTDGLHHQPTGRSVRLSLLLGVHSAADQLVVLLSARRPVIPAIRRSDFIVSFTGGLASWAGDSLAFVFFVQEFLAELGIPSVVGFCYIFASLRLSWCAIRLLHAVQIRVLILGSASGALISIFQTYFLWPCYNMFLHLLAGSGTTCIHIILRRLYWFFFAIVWSQLSWGLYISWVVTWSTAELWTFFLTLTPGDRVIYYQARGLNGYTSPSGECSAFFYPPYWLSHGWYSNGVYVATLHLR